MVKRRIKEKIAVLIPGFFIQNFLFTLYPILVRISFAVSMLFVNFIGTVGDILFRSLTVLENKSNAF